jgi:SDR family mycofactocin-dependent oxidoreductase
MTRPRASASRRSRLKPRPRPARNLTGGGAKRTALITGAARGIGAAVTKRLLADGFQVIALDRAEDDPRLDYAMGTQAELRALGAQPVVADATDPDALARAIKDVELDVIGCAAGLIAGGVDAWELEPEREQAVMEVCLGGVMTAARVGIPALLRRPQPREGRFIAIASTAASRGLPKLAAYCAAKAGVVGFVRALAVELGGTGITANCVSPGSTRTAILDETARLYELEAEAFASQQPLGRLIEPEEVAALVSWLASAQSRGATGGDYPLDGGLAL